jgi:hypothetical protein
MNKKLLPWLITLCALGLGGTAAYYSVIGLSKLFAGVATAVIIMASFLELSKLTLATLLHSYWNKLNKLSKVYYVISLIILSLITSAGIYGMLSSGYQETANKSSIIDNKITLIETKRDNVRDQLAVYNAEKSTINEAVSDLRSGLSNNTIQYKDRETGQIITTTSSSTRKALEKQLDQAIQRQTELNTKIDGLNTQLFDYETEIVEIQTGNDLAGELGPLKYLSDLTGKPMDKIINILLLIIIFVFDPLAIALVIAANFAFEQSRKKYKSNLYGEKIPVDREELLQKIVDNDQEMGLWDNTVDNEGSDIFTEDEIKDWDSTLNDGLEELEEEEFDKSNFSQIEEKIYSLEQQLIPGLSAFRSNKIRSEINKLKSYLPPPKNDDLVKTY